MIVTVVEEIPGQKVQLGELLVVTVVRAANVVRDIRENLRNLVGGRMKHYEELLSNAMQEGLRELEDLATEKGYDGVLGVKIGHPTVVEGGVELIIYGSGFYTSGREEIRSQT